MTKPIKLFVALSYILMITLNALANIIPINGQGTGAISDAYPNLFAPAGYTFGIWGVIYLLLGAFVIYMVRLPQSDMNPHKPMALKAIAIFFIISSVANAAWILAWHYRLIGLSVFLMLTILICLIRIMAIINQTDFNRREIIKLKPPIGVYFGWITVATIANITTFLVSLQWKGFGLSEELWLIIMLVIGVLVAVATMSWSGCGAFGLVLIWAYSGILSKHTSITGFNHQYPNAIWTLYISLAILVIVTLLTMRKTILSMKK